MHTDEFEISLSRELAVCRKAINKIEKSISLIEGKYGNGTIGVSTYPGQTGNHDLLRLHRELDQWRETLRQYEELYRKMKI